MDAYRRRAAYGVGGEGVMITCKECRWWYGYGHNGSMFVGAECGNPRFRCWPSSGPRSLDVEPDAAWFGYDPNDEDFQEGPTTGPDFGCTLGEKPGIDKPTAREIDEADDEGRWQRAEALAAAFESDVYHEDF